VSANRAVGIRTNHDRNLKISTWACLETTPSTRRKLPIQIL